MSSIVCVIVHPSRIVREGLTRILSNSPFEPACTASSVDDVPSSIAGAGEQVLVLIGVREENVAEDLSAAKASFPDAHVVVVGDANQRDLVTAALAMGATSFVDENIPTSTLIKELELVVEGEPVISVLIVRRLLGRASSPPSEEVVATGAFDELQPAETQGQAEQEQKSQLSGREAAILSALVQGASNKMIACQLKITEATVKVHVKAILRKIRVRNRTQAAIWALKCQSSPKRLSNENDGSPLSPASVGHERVDNPLIVRGSREGSRESAAH
jgi:two-component system, NarL family, nitrate/nitrite response regulator NarL